MNDETKIEIHLTRTVDERGRLILPPRLQGALGCAPGDLVHILSVFRRGNECFLKLVIEHPAVEKKEDVTSL